ncbi:hypothetical protein HPB48_012673 [Haemaphysalis longicornis]|uniref:Carboxylic ester hydrolase n=1 Tax=Haemaphysalis longicornis TaxID=44386 RepID=A0A9J6FZ85_HAELO|nr:hypothetical protein HPB48_012673 [Haemaphysalis longicornis]
MEVSGKHLHAYLGIPYAEPPVSDLRFKRPRQVSPWEGVYNATSKPPACRQVSVSLFGFAKLNYSEASEDCLYVNVWKPSQPPCSKGQNCPSRSLPVVVYFHGGGFQWGDSALMIYDPANFVALTDVVFVTFNYRLGFFGFLSLDTEPVPGNVGLWDQNMVLKWVRKNIASFGGNPEEVTIAGHSAGATSVALHTASPHSKGLFKRVIMQSGAPVSMVLTLFFSGQGKFINIAGSLGCYDTNTTFDGQINDVVSCLRQLDAGFIINKLENINFLKRIFAPVDNDEFLPFSVLSSKPWQNLNVENVLLGTTANEGSMFFHFLQNAFSVVDDLLATQYRTVSTVVLSQALHIPMSEAREIVFSYFGDYGVEHSYEEVRDVISDMFADATFNCPTQLFAEDAAQQGIGTHRYIFSYKPTHSFFPEWMGVAHYGGRLLHNGISAILKGPNSLLERIWLTH